MKSDFILEGERSFPTLPVPPPPPSPVAQGTKRKHDEVEVIDDDIEIL
jgi:hypothetical protein